MNKEDKKYKKQESNVININNNSLKEMKKTAAKQAEENVRKQQGKAEKKNYQLKNQLMKLQNEIALIKKQVPTPNQRNIRFNKLKELKLRININEQSNKEYLLLSKRQQSNISLLKQKIKFHKGILKQNTSKYSKQIQKINTQKNQQQVTINQKLEGLLQQLDLKQKYNTKLNELNQLTKLSNMIIKQRSVIEQFFVTYIDNLNKQIKQKQQVKRFKLPQINRPFEDKSKTYNEKVDISELDLYDKQKILRIIYTKMNKY